MDAKPLQHDDHVPLIVRPVDDSEKDRWRWLMNHHHYLGCPHFVGENIQYVAEEGGQWLALLGWTAAALKVGARDRWIGWNEIGKSKRLKHVVNNARFLILPDARRPYLASRVLALNTRRISGDWQDRYGHQLFLAETFVDTSRFRGTCYLAAGWLALGMTKGFRRDREQVYVQHGAPKMVFVRQLHRRVRERLIFPPSDGTSPRREISLFDAKRLPLEGNDGLIDVARRIVDPRTKAGRRHSLASVLAIATGAMLAGAKSFNAIAQWGKELTISQRRRLRARDGKAPSTSTIRRVLIGIDAATYDREIGDWLLRRNAFPEAIAIDGKALRGSHDGETKAVHLLSALLHREGIVIAQRRVSDKTNEIPAAKELLGPLSIKGSVVTADAMHCQTDTAKFIVEQKEAHYVFTVKDNQPTLADAMRSLDYGAISP